MNLQRIIALAMLLLMLAGSSIAADRKVLLELFTNAG